MRRRNNRGYNDRRFQGHYHDEYYEDQYSDNSSSYRPFEPQQRAPPREYAPEHPPYTRAPPPRRRNFPPPRQFENPHHPRNDNTRMPRNDVRHPQNSNRPPPPRAGPPPRNDNRPPPRNDNRPRFNERGYNNRFAPNPPNPDPFPRRPEPDHFSRPAVTSRPKHFSPGPEMNAGIPAQMHERPEPKPQRSAKKHNSSGDTSEKAVRQSQKQIRAVQEKIRAQSQSIDEPNLSTEKMDMDKSSTEDSLAADRPRFGEYEKIYHEDDHSYATSDFPSSRDSESSFQPSYSEHQPKTPKMHKHESTKKKVKNSVHAMQKAAKRKRKEQISELRAQARKRRKHSRGWRLNPLDTVPGPKNEKRWEILDRIGRGRFSDVFSALDSDGGYKVVAIKVDKEEVGRSREKDLLKKESEIMKELGDTPYSCAYIHFDKLSDKVIQGGGNFLVMELCKETNISDWRKKQPGQCFGPKKGAALGKEMLKALRHFHDKGWLHRDIKPSNFIQPFSPLWNYHCYIVDFGLAKRWRDKDGKIVPQSETEDFVGTSLYASLAAHEKRFQSRADDLWSLMFMIIDCATNRLPWKDVYLHMEGRPTHERRKKMYEMKKEFTENPGKFLEYKELLDFIDHLKTLGFECEPDYTKLLDLLQSMVDNAAYDEQQAEIDNSTVMVVIPRYAGLSSDRKSLCSYYLQCDQCPDEDCELEHPKKTSIYQQGMPLLLCYKGCINKCNAAKAGETCKLGYHWTEQEEAHFRATGMVPAQSLNPHAMLGSQSRRPICRKFAEHRVPCKCSEYHPKHLLDPNCPYTKTRPVPSWTPDEEDYFRLYSVVPEIDDVEPGPLVQDRLNCLHPLLRKKWEKLIRSDKCTVKLEDLGRLQIGESTITAIERSFEEFHQLSEKNDDARFEKMTLIIQKHTEHWKRMFNAFEEMYAKRIDESGNQKRAPEKPSQKGTPSEFPALTSNGIAYDNLDHAVVVALEEFVRMARRRLKDPQRSLRRLKPADAVKILAELQRDKDLAKFANLSKKLEQRVNKRLDEIKMEKRNAEMAEKDRKKRQEEQRRRMLQEKERRKNEDFVRSLEKDVVAAKPKSASELSLENQKRLEKLEAPPKSASKPKASKQIIVVNIDTDSPKKSPRIAPRKQPTSASKKPKIPQVSVAIPRKGRNQPTVTSPQMVKAIQVLEKKRKATIEKKKKKKKKKK